MIRIGITGVPGSGKTSLARGLCASLRKIEGLNSVELVSEYARRYISKHGDITSMWEQYRIFAKQKEWEDSVDNGKVDLMISDSPIYLGFIYCLELPKNTSKDIMSFNDVFKAMLRLNAPRSRYDIIFHLPPIIRPVEDGVRKAEYFEDEVRELMNEKIKVTTRDIFPPILFKEVLETDLHDRINTCIDIIKEKKNGR